MLACDQPHVALLWTYASVLAACGWHPVKLDEVGICVVPFWLMVAWKLDLFLDFALPDGWRILALC